MNNITQIKRGSTASWSLGPERVHWENLDVWGKDSLIRCEGTELRMNVYTASANYFYDENGQLEDVKRPGLWLIQPGEINWDASAQMEFKCQTSGPSDCWLEIYAQNISAIHGQKLPLGQKAQMTMPYIGEWGLYIRWPEQRENIGVANIKISIRQVDAYEELAPGQLGVEYTEDGKTKLKAGMPNISKWNELPYIIGEDRGFGEIAVGQNLLGAENQVSFEYGERGGVVSKVRPLELVANEEYEVEIQNSELHQWYTVTATFDRDGDVSLVKETLYGGGGDYVEIFHIKTDGEIKLIGYPVNEAPGWASYEPGTYRIRIAPCKHPQIQTIDPKFLPLPNPENMIFEGQGLVVKNKQWVLSDSPLVEKQEVMSLVGQYNAKFQQIEEELAQLKAMLEATPTE